MRPLSWPSNPFITEMIPSGRPDGDAKGGNREESEGLPVCVASLHNAGRWPATGVKSPVLFQWISFLP